MSSLIELARKLRPIIERAVESLDDETAIEATSLFPMWSGDAVGYPAGVRVRHNGVLYKVLVTHTSQPTWTPDAAHSLFAKVLIEDPNVIPEWEQPDSTNAYMTGDRVMFEGAVYESTVDNNVWSPAAYPAGWKKVG